MLPKIVIHADWSTRPEKRWACEAILHPEDNIYYLSDPTLVGNPRNMVRAAVDRSNGKGAILGFDFPIGLPRAFSARANIEKFLDILPLLGKGVWQEFFSVAENPADISLQRPFYPRRPGGTRRNHLIQGLGFAHSEDLLRRCENGYSGRAAACPLFWTLGGNQVGRAAISGWSDMLLPAMQALEGRLGIWPFEGSISKLIESKDAVIVETYPGDTCVQLGIGAPGRGWSKRKQHDRMEKGKHLIAIARHLHIDINNVRETIENGFGSDADGEDQFDAMIGLMGMISVIQGQQSEGVPQDDQMIQTVEGWILGQEI